MPEPLKPPEIQTDPIWWNGLSDKIVAFVGGVGVGMLLILVL